MANKHPLLKDVDLTHGDWKHDSESILLQGLEYEIHTIHT